MNKHKAARIAESRNNAPVAAVYRTTPSKRRREPIGALNLAPLLPELSAEVDTDLLLRWKFRKMEFRRNIFLDLPVYLVHGKRKGSR